MDATAEAHELDACLIIEIKNPKVVKKHKIGTYNICYDCFLDAFGVKQNDWFNKPKSVLFFR